MNLCIVDGKKIRDRRELHEALAAGLDLPAWYGGNLDALYDCLTEPVERMLKIQNFQDLARTLGPYAHRFFKVAADAARENPRFHLELEDPEESTKTAK